MIRKSFWKVSAALAIFGLALVFTGCDNPAASPPEPPPTPASVAITAPAETVLQGGSWQFSAVVGPQGASQAVVWSIEPSTAGTISSTGMLIPTAAANTAITVRAAAVNHPTVYDTVNVTVGAPVTPTTVAITSPAAPQG